MGDLKSAIAQESPGTQARAFRQLAEFGGGLADLEHQPED